MSSLNFDEALILLIKCFFSQISFGTSLNLTIRYILRMK